MDKEILGLDDQVDEYQKLQCLIEQSIKSGKIEGADVKSWDTQYLKWNFNDNPLDDPEAPFPGNHPLDEHPWNKGAQVQLLFLKNSGIDLSDQYQV